MTLPAHSPLGASGAHRWMDCPGSVTLSRGYEDPESDFAALGTAAHALAAHCLEQKCDAWTTIGRDFDGFVADKDMADAVQVYLDAIRIEHPDRDQGNSWIERKFHCPSVHEFFYGTCDFCYLGEDELHVWDYKHGAGVVVEVQNNPQLMYYAVGALTELELWYKVGRVVLHVGQPRGFHSDGPVRSWSITVEALAEWQTEVLVPAMDRALVSRDTASGEHCRFCPVRFAACPQHEADMQRMQELMQEIDEKGGAPEATNEQIGEFLTLFEIAKIRQKAYRETGFKRAQGGHPIPGWKLGKARSNRVWKDDVEPAAKKAFGKAAYTVPELKSPAQIDALPKGKAFTSQHAYKPDAGMTLIPADDSRADVGPNVRKMFSPVKKGK
jgi:hypothetical protein